MSQHTDQPGNGTSHDAVGRLVRPFTLVGGRTEPTRDIFTLITLITTARDPGPRRTRALPPEHRQIVQMCTMPKAVAEVAALLDLPVSVATILLSDLLDEGLITAHAPVSASEDGGLALLHRVRDGLARL
ncbi:DUF742 domain-containing protein [Streptomyces sp. NBC_01210]|uniref:DUF742 domain-containing protein n=1 Tax=Streptomyces sp. NBC_01210 TaxID=2903774 RepID=UPI002E108873|nr:DUF742 domain-containing protein [Streptomyces sp. NBC_01210]